MMENNANQSELKFINVYKEEQKFISGTSNQPDLETFTKESIGLALSGGGIRSASFSLGAIQAMVKNSFLHKVKYLSTVSGGGYIGSALTWALHHRPDADLTEANFPLGKARQAARNFEKSSSPKTESQTSGENEEEKGNLLDFIRQHCNYLLPTNDLGAISFGAVVFRGILFSLLFYFGLMVLIALIGICAFDFLAPFLPSFFKDFGIFLPLALLLFLAYFFLSLMYSIGTAGKIDGLTDHKGFIKSQEISGCLWQGILICLIIGSIPPAVQWLESNEGSKWLTGTVAGTSSLFGTIVAIWQYVKALKKEKEGGDTPAWIIYLAAFALIYGLMILSFSTANYIYIDLKTYALYLGIGLAGFLFLLGTFVNLNQVGPHRVYRNRLMETFLPDQNAVDTNQWQMARKADKALMADMCQQTRNQESKTEKIEEKKFKAPYHIINTNLILTNAKKEKYRGRGGDNFIFSPLFCGSDATGWLSSEKYSPGGKGPKLWFKKIPHKLTGGWIKLETLGINESQDVKKKGMTLASAMAASGAAFNPNAGGAGSGITRNRILSLLLSLLNLRLGIWVSNPKLKQEHFGPNYFRPGILGELLNTEFYENSKRLMLSDGGHFENLGLYELVRRQLKTIILVDGSADPNFNFDDLSNAVQRIKVDFGTIIRFTAGPNETDILSDLNEIVEPVEGNALYEKLGVVKKGFAVAEIEYPNATKGKLFYLKLALVPNLPADVYGYKGLNSDFPHQSTADQFFDEKQFEAYRELGYYSMYQMMESAQWKNWMLKMLLSMGS